MPRLEVDRGDNGTPRQLFHFLFFVRDTQRPGAEILFHLTYPRNKALHVFGVGGKPMIRAGQFLVQGKMAFEITCTHGHGPHRRRQSLAVIRKSDGMFQEFPQLGNLSQIHVFLGSRIFRYAMAHDDLVVTGFLDGFHGTFYIPGIGHSRRNDHRLSLPGDIAEKRRIDDVIGADLERAHAHLLEKIDGVTIGGRRQGDQSAFPHMGKQALKFAPVELTALEHLHL